MGSGFFGGGCGFSYLTSVSSSNFPAVINYKIFRNLVQSMIRVLSICDLSAINRFLPVGTKPQY